MPRIVSAISCYFLLLRIHEATSLSQIPLPELVENKMEKKQFQTALIIGSSVDRDALSSNYPGQTYAFKDEPYQHSVVQDMQGRNLGMAVLQHAGVGLHGDLDYPFWNPGMAHAIAHAENNESNKPLGTTPANPNDGK